MKIEFIPFKEESNEELIHPIPAIKKLPQWYKNKKPFRDGTDKPENYGYRHTNITVKWCNPFSDAAGSGYFILLENDIQVYENLEKNLVVTWSRGEEDFVGSHPNWQISEELIPKGFRNSALKFTNHWGIKTPPGYSVMINHPLNRYDLPFMTLSGIVDTDTYNMPINFPFFIKKDFEGVIEAGTPIAQIIPFKRESWKSSMLKYDEAKARSIETAFQRKVFRPYKLNYWHKKEWR